MSHFFKVMFVVTPICLVLAGCAATPLTPQASRILLTPNPAPKGCKYLGTVTGNQGNFFTGAWTSNAHLEEGATNVIRNKAADLGANYVQMFSNRAGVTGNEGGQQQTNVVYTGNAYNCPKLD